MRRLLLAATLAAAVAGCDSALDPEPFGIETVENLLSSPEGAVTWSNGFYQPLSGLYGSFGASMITVLESGTDDGWPFAQFAEGFKSRDITGGENEIQSIWSKSLGDGIGRANTYLATEGDIDWTDQEALRDQLRGEAHFFRAFYYFNLVRLFGDVPIYTEPVLSVGDAQLPRSPTADVYALIKSDLAEAVALLPESHPNSGLGGERGRVTSGAARTVLGKVHLTLEEWQAVLDATGPTVGAYSLEDEYVDNFYGLILDTSGENEGEAIFEVQFSEDPNGPRHQIRPSFVPRDVRDGQNQIIPTDARYLDNEEGAAGPNAFVQAVDTSDARFDVLLSLYPEDRRQLPQTSLLPLYDEDGEVVRDADGDVVFQREYFVRKWWSDVSNQDTRWNVPLFRYAEVLLMRAEALNELGRTAEALALVDQVRERAELDPLASDAAPADQGSVREAVYRERRIEFAFEFKRLFDLNRWGRLPAAVAAQGVTIAAGKVTPHPITGKPQVLYPIPQSELIRNPNATQNAGY